MARLVYREARPDARLDPPLASFVTRFYEVEVVAAADPAFGGTELDTRDPLLRRLLPNADANLIFDLGTPRSWRSSARLPRSRGRSFAAGVVTEPRAGSFGPGTHLFGVAFAVGRAEPLLPVPANELADRIVSLADVWGDEAAAIETGLGRLRSFEERAERMGRALRPRLGDAPAPDDDLAEILAQARSTSAAVRVDALARGAGLSRQRFTRWFRDRVGMGPKRFFRIARAEALLHHALTGRREPWADVAGRFGYFDQAHMIAEFTWLTGTPPERFVRDRARSTTAEPDRH
jgi:AraC-like DNA-binding protein